MSKQNIIPFNKEHVQIKVTPTKDKEGNFTGEISEEGQLFFSINTQFLRQVLSTDGHATPSRTSAELKTLSVPQYTSRYNYNSDTDNSMVNIQGTYKNVTVNYPYSPSNTLNPTRFEWFTDTGNQLYASLNGVLYQSVFSALPNKLFFQPDGNNQLFTQINGVQSQVVLADPTNPIRLSVSGTDLIVSVAGVNYQIPMTAILEKIDG